MDKKLTDSVFLFDLEGRFKKKIEGGWTGPDALNFPDNILVIDSELMIYLGGGDMESFPSLDFVEPDLHQDAIDGERTIDIQVGQ